MPEVKIEVPTDPESRNCLDLFKGEVFVCEDGDFGIRGIDGAIALCKNGGAFAVYSEQELAESDNELDPVTPRPDLRLVLRLEGVDE